MIIISFRRIVTGGRLAEGALRRMVSSWVRSWVAGRIYFVVVVVMCTCSGGRLESVNEASLSHIVSIGGRMGWVMWYPAGLVPGVGS